MPSISLNLEAGATCVTAESPASENHRGSCGSNKGPISMWRFNGKRAASETATLQSLSRHFISLFLDANSSTKLAFYAPSSIQQYLLDELESSSVPTALLTYTHSRHSLL